jgi:hypothetical protein
MWLGFLPRRRSFSPLGIDNAPVGPVVKLRQALRAAVDPSQQAQGI